ncbi:MAG: DUF692 domain-containing protein, partial [Planctomycetes bacterium]|nr:DUF692 domain-containing protein [Planctomycetota bacterium]
MQQLVELQLQQQQFELRRGRLRGRRRLRRMRRQLIGVGYRRELAGWIASRPPEIGCLEITAEHFFDRGLDALSELRRDYPLFVHGLGLSLGTPGPLDRAALDAYARVVEAADPLYVTEHVAFTRTRDVDLGHLNPVARTPENLGLLADHAREVMDRCGRPMLLENIASPLSLKGGLSEPEFLNRLCDRAGCGLLLDVTNLTVNSRNHRFDPIAWLDAIEPRNIAQLHVVGYTRRADGWHDAHAEPIQDELFDLARLILERSPVRGVIVERDENMPAPEE